MKRSPQTFFPTNLACALAETLEISEKELIASLQRFQASFPFFSRLSFRFLSESLDQSSLRTMNRPLFPSRNGSLIWEYGNPSLEVSPLLSDIDVFSLTEARLIFDVLLDSEPLHLFWKTLYGLRSPSEGLFVYVPPGLKVTIDFFPCYLGKKWLEQATIYFVLGKDASLRLLEKPFVSPGKHWGQMHLHLLGQEGSSLVLERDWDHLLSPFSFFTSIRLEKGASCTCISRGTKSPWIWADYGVALMGEEAKIHLGAVHTLSHKQRFSLTTSVRHEAPKTFSNQLMKKILESGSHSFFGGQIDIQKGSSEAEAYQLNRDLLLSEEVSASSSPALCIRQGDVKATHGSTASGLDSELLFFLATRGFAKEEAKEIAVQAFINELSFFGDLL